MSFKPTDEQDKVLSFNKKNLIVSASAGSGKTSTLIEFITQLVAKGQPIKRVLLLTFTRAASFEMKEKLIQNFYEQSDNDNVLSAIDDVSTADISTIHAFLERMLKRNTNILPVSEGFVVLSQEEIDALKQSAFEETEKEFKGARQSDYEKLYLNLHNNRAFIFNLLNEMSAFFATQINAREKIDYYKANQKEFYRMALLRLDEMFLPQIEKIKSNLSIIKVQLDDEKFTEYIEKILNVLREGKDSLAIFRNIVTVEIKTPPTSKKVDPLALASLKEEYKNYKHIKDELTAINVCDERIYNEEAFGIIENIIYDLYLLYEEKFAYVKEKLNAVDFNDLEKYAKAILSNEEIKTKLQTDYDYIFIDEYQDTNHVQEEIVKLVASQAHFIAVGDPKQGIYGFRNATSEIIKKDIKDFSEDANSSAEFLRKNFRSDGKILNFVNDVFVDVMREDTVGIDYLETSMLKAGKEEEPPRDDQLPSVRVDIVKKPKDEKLEEFQEVYDICEDSNLKKSSKSLEAKVIATRIEELMLRKIYDAKIDALRNVTYKDIVILTRGKSELVTEIIRELSVAKIPVVSEVKGNFKDYAEILVLINLFKIMLDFEDDSALLGVMLSKIGGFTLDEVAKLRLESSEKEFFNVVKNSQDKKVKSFVELINSLKFKFDAKGAFVMLEELFDSVEFRPYILSKPNAQNYMFVLDKFMEQIKTSDKQFDLPALVKFLEQEKIDFKGGGNSANAVSICTIHSSKGLEYPVVILADTGKAMLQPMRDSYIMNSEFGLGLNFFSLDDDNVYQTPLVYIMKSQQKRRERNDEIMLLYVALTRAQRHLYIVGTVQDKTLDTICEKAYEAKSFMEMILSAKKSLLSEEKKEELAIERVEANVITEVEDIWETPETFIGEPKADVCEKLKKYFDFEYAHKQETQTIYKNSVSSINELGKPVTIVGKTDEEFVERGNAYHLALKDIDFEKIATAEDAKKALSEINDEGVKKYVEAEVLFENIMLLKSVLKNSSRIFKETQFTSLVKLNEVFVDGADEEIMVQGIVDLFALGEENVLVDYKFTNDTSDISLKNRYKKQLLLYKYAIEKAYNIEIKGIYLLSLKNNKLINF